jgi:hypothetical protein
MKYFEKEICMLKSAALIFAFGFSLATAQLASAQVGMIDETEAFSTIESAGTAAARIRSISEVPAVGVIWLDVHSLPMLDSRSADASDYRIAAGRHAGEIKRLRAALRSNPATRRTLAKHGIAVDRVVGVRIGSNGALRIFVL